jgi:hypothetical protein
MPVVIAWIMLGLALLLNVAASLLLLRSTVATPVQKALQLVFVWAVPFVGSIIVIAVLKETVSNPRSRRDFCSTSEVWLPGIGPDSGSAGAHHLEHTGSSEAGHGGDAGFGGH